ncbi:hypothetical protein [Streptomyces sp. NPDC047000]|uniref:hypothetical protein n=1 Tax=Streptomyces sp. NPDC047000 TaxID=3155474 RepID=UPI0033E1A7E1
MAAKPAPKHLTITIDFDLETAESTVRYKRAHEAFEAAVEAAIREARKALPPDSIRAVTSEIHCSYSWERDAEVRRARPDTDDTRADAGAEKEHVTADDVFVGIEKGRRVRQRTVPGGDVEIGPFED